MRIFRLLPLLIAPLAAGEIIDRVAVTVGDRVITESQVIEELRVTAFLEGQPVDLSGAQKRKAAERLVEQTLIRREVEFTRVQLPGMKDIGDLLAQVKSRYTGEQQYLQALKDHGITEEQLKEHLLWQFRLVRFVDIRFRPGVQISQSELRKDYEGQVADWKAKGETPIPTFEDARAKIEAALSAEKANQALDRWLTETRAQTEIVFHPKVFQ